MYPDEDRFLFSCAFVADIFVSLRLALREHWPEYLIEGWALGSLMISIGSFVTVLESPKSPLYALVPSSSSARGAARPRHRRDHYPVNSIAMGEAFRGHT